MEENSRCYLGDRVTSLVLPFAGRIQLVGGQVALVSAAHFIPFALLALPAGVWADRLNRKTIIIISDTIRLLCQVIGSGLGVLPLAGLELITGMIPLGNAVVAFAGALLGVQHTRLFMSGFAVLAALIVVAITAVRKHPRLPLVNDEMHSERAS